MRKLWGQGCKEEQKSNNSIIILLSVVFLYIFKIILDSYIFHIEDFLKEYYQFKKVKCLIYESNVFVHAIINYIENTLFSMLSNQFLICLN